jgi:hypothetical protein
VKRFLLAFLLLPLAAAAAPLSRPAVQACLDEVTRNKLPVADAGSACSALLARIKAGADGVSGDADLAQGLGMLSADALRDFAATLPTATAAGRPRADSSKVEAILAGLPDPAARPLSFWEKVDAWLRRLLAPPGQNGSPDLPGWLLRLLEPLRHIPRVAVKAMVWLLFALLLASLVWVVVRELRAAGVALRRRRPVPKPVPLESELPPARLLEGLPARERPAALLRWVIGRLVERGELPADVALTNRELQHLLTPVLQTPFGALTGFAERAFFGGISLSNAEMDQTVDLAQALTQQDVAA